MPGVGTLTFKVVIKNKRALRALARVAEFVEDQAEDRPWDEDLQRTRRAARYAIKHLKPTLENKK